MADNVKIKDPHARLPFAFNWSDWLSDWEEIESYEITISPSAVTGSLVNEGAIISSGCVVFILSGGTPKTRYNVACRITTSGSSYIDERTMKIDVKNR